MSRSMCAALLVPLLFACQQPQAQQTAASDEAAVKASGATPGSAEWKIESAMSAAPADVAANATIMDWPAEGSNQMTELRKGSNGFTCMPDVPSTDGTDPMCLDSEFMSWAGAWQSKGTPKVTRVGVAYMLAGDGGASVTDPYATDAATTADWVDSGKHIMILVPDAKDLEGVATKPDGGVPYVMWKGTPYAHIMMPIMK